ncbi:hypothetical protein IJ765_00220 [Candidatus Saccharibacteria bacterium]|nr:hypothetical protein [Candidatus Saccharibacteria bacterium]
MNPQDQNTYVGPPPRAVDPNVPQDPYLMQQQQPAYDPNQQPAPVQNNQSTPIQPIIEPVQGGLNDYNTPQLSAQIQMAQQAGVQAQQVAQAQTVSEQMAAQPTPAIPPEQQAQTGDPAKQTYKTPLVISNSVARAFAYLAILTIVVAVVNFIVNQFSNQFSSSEIYNTVLMILSRINTVALFARIVCVGFAVAATVIRVYNPHPYNTKNAIAAWVFAILSLIALIIFK